MNKIRTLVSVLALHLFFYNITFSQSSQRIDQLKNVIPPSPNSASLGKYGDWPVSLYTGLVSINIPLVELKGNEGSVPVGISYHASGIKVGEVSSNVGLGWALQAGGVITRSVKGLPDEDPAGYFQTRNLFNNPGDLSQGMINPSLDEQVQSDIASGARDLDPDYYVFNALGKAFVLFFDGQGNVLTQPYSKIKVTVNFVTKLWVVTLEDGTNLKFGGGENFVERNICSCFGESSSNYISSWMLESVTYPNGEKFSFTYTQTGFQNDMPYYEDMMKTVYKSIDVISQNISTIESNLGRIDFVYNSTNRQDISNGGALSSIKLFSKTTNQYIRQYNFIQNYSQAAVGNYYSNNLSYFNFRLKLLSVEEVSPENTTVKNAVWQFQYNALSLPSRHSYAQDHWGYYNGATNNTTLLPQAGPFNPPTYIIANRAPDANFMQAEMLVKVIYPTGGSSQFEYEPNGYSDINGFHIVGGLRIKSTIDVNDIDVSKNIKKNYLYEDPYVLHDFQPDDYLSVVTMKTFDCAHIPPYETGSADVTFRSSSTKSALGSIQGGNIGYGKVTTQFGDNALNGKIVSEYSNINDLNADASKVFPYPSATSREWRRGLLLSESYFSSSGINPIKKITNSYDFINKANIITYKAGFRITSISGCLPYTQGLISSIINRVFYSTITEQVRLISSIEENYDNIGNKLSITTNYFYDNPNNLSPTRVESIDSKGVVTKLINRTPLDKAEINAVTPLSSTASIAIDSLVARNNISTVLLKENYRANILQTRSIINYRNWDAKITLPENIQIQIKNNPLETKILFNKYDATGNLQEQQKLNDVKECYLWGYSNHYLVAKIIGKSYNETIAQSGIDINVINNPVDESTLRLELNKLRNLTDVFVTTYTHQPLIGVSSETDSRGKTLYYEYDAFKRLALIRDQDHNILKKICYNYAGQPENCSFFGNPQMSQTFTKTNCSSDYVGTSGTYTVPPNKYFSATSLNDAQAQAQKDIDLNGQTFVNNNSSSGATCIPMVKSTNTGTIPYTVSITNIATGTVSTVTAYPSSSSVQIGQLTPGNYNITLTPYSVTTSQISLNGNTQTGGTISFSNVVVSTPILITITPVSGGPCSFTMNSGYSSPSNNITNNGTTVSFYMIFYSTSVMVQGNNYQVATINGSCRPSAIRTITTSVGGRNWTITIYPDGRMFWQMAYGSAQLNPYSTVGTSTLTYSL